MFSLIQNYFLPRIFDPFSLLYFETILNVLVIKPRLRGAVESFLEFEWAIQKLIIFSCLSCREATKISGKYSFIDKLQPIWWRNISFERRLSRNLNYHLLRLSRSEKRRTKSTMKLLKLRRRIRQCAKWSNWEAEIRKLLSSRNEESQQERARVKKKKMP